MSELALNYTKPQRAELQAFIFVQNGLFPLNEQRLLNPPAYSFCFLFEYLRVLPVDLVTAHDSMLRNRRKVYTVVYGMCLMLLHPLIDRPTGFADLSSVTIRAGKGNTTVVMDKETYYKKSSRSLECKAF